MCDASPLLALDLALPGVGSVISSIVNAAESGDPTKLLGALNPASTTLQDAGAPPEAVLAGGAAYSAGSLASGAAAGGLLGGAASGADIYGAVGQETLQDVGGTGDVLSGINPTAGMNDIVPPPPPATFTPWSPPLPVPADVKEPSLLFNQPGGGVGDMPAMGQPPAGGGTSGLQKALGIVSALNLANTVAGRVKGAVEGPPQMPQMQMPSMPTPSFQPYQPPSFQPYQPPSFAPPPLSQNTPGQYVPAGFGIQNLTAPGGQMGTIVGAEHAAQLTGLPDATKTAQQAGADAHTLQMNALRGALKGTVADATARAGGGISPLFLANLVAQRAGQPDASQDALTLLRQQYPQFFS